MNLINVLLIVYIMFFLSFLYVLVIERISGFRLRKKTLKLIINGEGGVDLYYKIIKQRGELFSPASAYLNKYANLLVQNKKIRAEIYLFFDFMEKPLFQSLLWPLFIQKLLNFSLDEDLSLDDFYTERDEQGRIIYKKCPNGFSENFKYNDAEKSYIYFNSDGDEKVEKYYPSGALHYFKSVEGGKLIYYIEKAENGNTIQTISRDGISHKYNYLPDDILEVDSVIAGINFKSTAKLENGHPAYLIYLKKFLPNGKCIVSEYNKNNEVINVTEIDESLEPSEKIPEINHIN